MKVAQLSLIPFNNYWLNCIRGKSVLKLTTHGVRHRNLLIKWFVLVVE